MNMQVGRRQNIDRNSQNGGSNVPEQSTNIVLPKGEEEDDDIVHIFLNILFLLERPNLFAICNNTFSKWWEG
jgi:hypothetical protein